MTIVQVNKNDKNLHQNIFYKHLRIRYSLSKFAYRFTDAGVTQWRIGFDAYTIATQFGIIGLIAHRLLGGTMKAMPASWTDTPKCV